MRPWQIVPLLALLVTASGCYTTVVDTGREPSRRKFRDEWVMGFASGLIMPERVYAGRRCEHGVARVKTEQSLPNVLVQTVTAGLLSPRTVEVTCAAGPLETFVWEARRESRERAERVERWERRERNGRHRHLGHRMHSFNAY